MAIVRDHRGRFTAAKIQSMAQSVLSSALLEEPEDASVSIEGAQVIDAPKYLCLACGAITNDALCKDCQPFWTYDPKGHFGIRQSYWNQMPNINYPGHKTCAFNKEFAFDYHGVKFEPSSYAPTPRMVFKIPEKENILATSSPENLVNEIYRAISELQFFMNSCTSAYLRVPCWDEGEPIVGKLENLFKRTGTDLIRNGVQIYIKEAQKASEDYCKSRSNYGYVAKKWTNDEIAKITDKVKSYVCKTPKMDWIFQREWDAPASYLVNSASCWWDGSNRGQSRCVAKAAGAFTVLDRTARLRMVILPVIFAQSSDRSILTTTPAYKDGVYRTPDAFIIYNSYLRKNASSREELPDDTVANSQATGWGVYSPNLARVAHALAIGLESQTGKTMAYRQVRFEINRTRYESYVNNESAGIVCLKELHDLSGVNRVVTNVSGECRNHGN